MRGVAKVMIKKTLVTAIGQQSDNQVLCRAGATSTVRLAFAATPANDRNGYTNVCLHSMAIMSFAAISSNEFPAYYSSLQ